MRIAFRAATAIVVTLLIACASSPDIKAGWDKNVDFSKYYTWEWKADGSIRDPVWAKRCQDVLGDVLATRKLAPISVNPDLWVIVHARLSSETVVVPYDPAWGYTWGAWAMADFPGEEQIPVGTIVVDMVDARRKVLVWRGRAHGAIAADRTNEQREQKLTQILTEMFAGYPPTTSVSRQAALAGVTP
jgi:hypothetical protein